MSIAGHCRRKTVVTAERFHGTIYIKIQVLCVPAFTGILFQYEEICTNYCPPLLTKVPALIKWLIL